MTLRPETMHQLLFTFSPRGIPDGYRYMHGFGSHTFKLVNKNSEQFYCKFHFKVGSQQIKLNIISTSCHNFILLDQPRSSQPVPTKSLTVVWQWPWLCSSRPIQCHCSWRVPFMDPFHPSHDIWAGWILPLEPFWHDKSLASGRVPIDPCWKSCAGSQSSQPFCWSGADGLLPGSHDSWHWSKPR